MESHPLDERVARLRDELGLPGTGGASPVDAAWPLLERMRADGAVVVLKLDGQRTGEEDEGPYTVVLSGGGLGEDFVRTDARSMGEALADAVLQYARAAWPHLAG